ncbi:MAG: hypothetical protein ACTH5S_08975 [Hafnia alvei]|uniref:hypothetical protein n=1 Tax=Hafnia TaxID=568 RepID=UPI00266D9DBD|nr:hypothetical protein [Hafnia paralvei]
MRLLTGNTFERLANQRLVTISEVVNSLYGLNPNTRTKDLPEDIAEEAADIKKAIMRNIRSLGEQFVTPAAEIDSDLVFGAAYSYVVPEITPVEIKDRAIEAITAYMGGNQWESVMFAFGGRSLVDEIARIRKTGRGQHKKKDEESGTMKMLGLLIKLIAQKSTGNKYGTSEAPIIASVYRDILALVETENLTTKGIGKSTFAAKAAEALAATKEF